MFAWFQGRLLSPKRRRTSRVDMSRLGARLPLVESLESRRLLTVTASVLNGALSVQISGTDTAIIREDAKGDVLVTNAAGTTIVTGVLANTITSITVNSLGTNDTTDLTQVGKSADFTSLATIDIAKGLGAQVLLSGTYTTTSDQTYAAAATLKGDAFVNSGGSLDFGSTIDGGFTLTNDAKAGVTFGGAIGSAAELTALFVNTGPVDLNAGSVHTTAQQVYVPAVTLSVNTVLTSDTDSVEFGSTVDGPFSLTTNTASTTSFGGAVGATAPLTSLTTSGAGQTALSSSVNTSGSQVYQQDVLLNGAAAGDLIALNTQGGNVTFDGKVDSFADVGNPQFALSVNTNGAGTTTFLGTVGGAVGLSSLSVTSGVIDLNGGSVTTSGAQTYRGPTTLTVNTSVISNSGNISFLNTINGAFALSATASSVVLDGAVGTATELTTLNVNASTLDLNAGTVHTSGNQDYFPAVTLTTNTQLISDTAAVVFVRTVNGAFSLTISDATSAGLNGAVGGTAPLTSLTIAGGANINLGGPVSTTGNQSYQQPVRLLHNVTLTTEGGNVSFASTIDGPPPGGEVVPPPVALTIDTTAAGAVLAGGLVQFGGDIGDTKPLSTLTVTAAGPMTIAHKITTLGNQLLTVVPSASASNGLTVAAGGSLSTTGTVELRSGGNLTIAAGANVTASSITLRGDFNNAIPAAASVMLLAGTLQSPTIAVFTGNGNTTVNLARTLANTTTTINGGAGIDTYNLSSAAPAANGVLSTLAGALIVNGGSGPGTLVLGDAGNAAGAAGTLTSGLVTGFGMANGLAYSNLQSIVFQLSAGPAETLTILSTSSGTSVAVNGGQTVVIGGGPGGLDPIVSSIAINGAAVLDVNDQQTTSGHTYDIAAGYIMRTGAANLAPLNDAALPGQVGITLANVRQVTITGGPQNDLFNVFLPLAAGRTVVIQGGGGADNDVNVIGSNAAPNTAYVGNVGGGDPIQISGIDCLTMYGAPNQPNAFVNQTAVPSILIGGLLTDTLVGGSGPDVLFGGAGNDLLDAGGTAGAPGTDYTFADLLPAYLPNGMLNTNVSDPTTYPGLPGTKFINGGGGVVVYFNNGTGVVNASSVTFMQCDLPGSRALLQSIFNQALAANPCLATLTSPPSPPATVGTLAELVDYSPFVEHAFETILGRAADPASLSYWTGQLVGGMSRAAFAGVLTHSDEYYRRLVASGFETYLGRPAAAADIAYWANQFEQGLSDQQFEAVLLGSDEFVHENNSNSAWIDAVYRALLGRPADAQSEQTWSNQLQAGESHTAIAVQIASSPEAEALLVIDDYQRYLGRSPTQVEINYWVGQLAGGLSNEGVLANFVASDEFFFAS